METLIGQQTYNPHLKKVLKTYQLSAVKSLQGPSTVLGSEEPSRTTLPQKKSTYSPEPTPPLPVQQLPPILTTPDRSHSERSETVLEGESISCFVVGGEKRLCLPHILNSVLRDFSLAQINQVCDELQIFCSRCNHEQLEELKVSGILPTTAPSCGLITKTDAERLCSSLLHRQAPSARLLDKPVSVQIKVYHECFGKCRGVCMPELYTDSSARCIECAECHGLFAPQTFVCHAHRYLENRTCHWGFDSSNWRAYLLMVEDQPDHERRAKLFEYFKEQFTEVEHCKKRKEMLRVPRKKMAECVEMVGEKLAVEEDEVVACKRAKLEDSGLVSPSTAAVYLQHYDAFHYYNNWYESWARNMGAWRATWGPSLGKESKHVPAYLSHDPPVLLHPERVVPLSQMEQFESNFQPNVALAPPAHRHETVPKQEPVTEGKEKRPLLAPKQEPPATPTATFGSEIELSTDTEDSASETNNHENAVGSVVEQVAAVLDALSDAKEATRLRVIGLVERLAVRLDRVEADNRRLRAENHHLQQQLQRVSKGTEERSPERKSPDVAGSASATPPAVPEPPRSSPVSVITSPATAIVKTEPQ